MNQYDILEVKSVQTADEMPKSRERIAFRTFLDYQKVNKAKNILSIYDQIERG